MKKLNKNTSHGQRKYSVDAANCKVKRQYLNYSLLYLLNTHVVTCECCIDTGCYTIVRQTDENGMPRHQTRQQTMQTCSRLSLIISRTSGPYEIAVGIFGSSICIRIPNFQLIQRVELKATTTLSLTLFQYICSVFSSDKM